MKLVKVIMWKNEPDPRVAPQHDLEDHPCFVAAHRIVLVQPSNLLQRYAILLDNGLTLQCKGSAQELVDEINGTVGTRGQLTN